MSSTMSAWRVACDPDELREYDRFGPWIDRVTEAVDMPRRFRPWWPELRTADYLLKVPRSYDRSQVRPGMDLYESVIAAFPNRVCVLRADPTEVVRRDVARDEIVATVRHTNLLLGRWSLLLGDGSSFTVDFNAVSHTTIGAVDTYLLSQASDGWSQSALPVVAPKDHFFQSTVATLNARAKDAAHPVHVEEPGQPCRHGVQRRRSAGMMVLATPDDLVIVNRDMAMQPLLRHANYASNIIRIPFRLMTGFDLFRPEVTSPPRFSHLTITCDRQVISQPFRARPDTVADLLVAHGVPALR